MNLSCVSNTHAHTTHTDTHAEAAARGHPRRACGDGRCFVILHKLRWRPLAPGASGIAAPFPGGCACGPGLPRCVQGGLSPPARARSAPSPPCFRGAAARQDCFFAQLLATEQNVCAVRPLPKRWGSGFWLTYPSPFRPSTCFTAAAACHGLCRNRAALPMHATSAPGRALAGPVPLPWDGDVPAIAARAPSSRLLSMALASALRHSSSVTMIASLGFRQLRSLI